MGESCKKSSRKCSTAKHFDIVDLENMAFKNLYIDERQDGKAIAKVSRYPRAVMPNELKDRFEVYFRSED